MAKVTIREVEVLNNDCSFVDKFQFKIRFDCIEDLQEDLDWKILYVGSANSTEFDQELDELSTGPIPVGVHEFVLEADGPDPTKIPASEIVGVTVVLITCSYRTQEFVRIGYYINNEYQDEQLREDPPEQPIIEKLSRVISSNPRVTRLQINWDGTENIMPEQKTISDDFGFGELLADAMADEPGKPKDIEMFCQSMFSGENRNENVQNAPPKFAEAPKANQPSMPQARPGFVENSMDCHNVEMNID